MQIHMITTQVKIKKMKYIENNLEAFRHFNNMCEHVGRIQENYPYPSNIPMGYDPHRMP